MILNFVNLGKEKPWKVKSCIIHGPYKVLYYGKYKICKFPKILTITTLIKVRKKVKKRAEHENMREISGTIGCFK